MRKKPPAKRAVLGSRTARTIEGVTSIERDWQGDKDWLAAKFAQEDAALRQ